MSAFLQRTLAVVLGILCLLSLSMPALANEQQIEARRKVVLEEQEAVSRAQKELSVWRETQQSRLAALQVTSVSATALEQARVDVEAARVQMESAEVDRQTAERTVQELKTAILELEEKIKQAKSTAAGKPTVPQVRTQELRELQDALARKRALQMIEEQHLRSRAAAKTLAEERLAFAEEWLKSVEALYRTTQEQNQRVALEELQGRLEKEQQEWLIKAEQWRRDLARLQGGGIEIEAQRHLLETRAQDAEERARLSQLRLRLAQIEGKYDVLTAGPLTHDQPPETLKAALEQVTALHSELSAIQSLLNQKISVLQQQQTVIAKRASMIESAQEERRIFDRLIRSLQQPLDATTVLLDKIKDRPREIEAAYDESVRRGLLAQRVLPTDAEGWSGLIQDALELPSAVVQRLWESAAELGQALTQMSPDRWVSLILVELFWLAATHWLHVFLVRISTRIEATRSFLAATLAAFTHLTQRTLPSMAAAGALLFVLWMTHPSQQSFTILLTLIGVWLGVTVLVNLARAVLVSPHIPESRQRPRLYRQLRGMLLIGGVLTALILLGHIVIASTPLRNLIDRSFMLFLILITLPVLEIRRITLDTLAARLGERYWLRIVRLLSLLIPLSILAGAAVGVAGYINLAWTIGKYLGSYLVALAAWLILSNLAHDLAVALKNHLNLNSRFGLLWAQGVIDPLYRLGRAALFIVLLIAPVWIYGGGAESPVMRVLQELLHTPLFTIGTKSIHIQHMLLTGLAIWITVRAGRWIRVITYRWAFAGISDLGARHSLSVFAQYAVVLIGLLITLRVIGIDLTTLAIFAGALGVGIGFGLQNIANNFISGILLLIERPLRANDIVRIGEYEGEVTQIGMRSMTLKTWDNQEVIIPNSEAISNPFTNWTHSDNIVRTTFTVGVSYEADPHQAKEVIERALRQHPNVLADPEPDVWLKEFADSAVNFHVQYFVDLRSSRRAEIKSDVLLIIWDALKEAGIEIPYPKRDIYIKALPPAAEDSLYSRRKSGRDPSRRVHGAAEPSGKVHAGVENPDEAAQETQQEDSTV